MRLLSILLICACLAVAACADSGDRSGDNSNNRFGGFYTGGNLGGGVAR